jgi:hypothetical protein
MSKTIPSVRTGDDIAEGQTYPHWTEHLYAHPDEDDDKPVDGLIVVHRKAIAMAFDENLEQARLKGIAQMRNVLIMVMNRYGKGSDAAAVLAPIIVMMNAMLGYSRDDFSRDEIAEARADEAASNPAPANPFQVRAPT